MLLLRRLVHGQVEATGSARAYAYGEMSASVGVATGIASAEAGIRSTVTFGDTTVTATTTAPFAGGVSTSLSGSITAIAIDLYLYAEAQFFGAYAQAEALLASWDSDLMTFGS